MKLLLDEMHAAAAALQLRDRGVDALAITERPDLRGQSDLTVLRWASAEGRVVVTENVRDFIPLIQQWALEGADHAGVVLTNPRRFVRSLPSYPTDLVEALDALHRTGWPPGPSAVHWL